MWYIVASTEIMVSLHLVTGDEYSFVSVPSIPCYKTVIIVENNVRLFCTL